MAARRDGDGDEVREARDALLELGRGPVRGVVADEPDHANELGLLGSISRAPEVVGRIFMTDGEGGSRMLRSARLGGAPGAPAPAPVRAPSVALTAGAGLGAAFAPRPAALGSGSMNNIVFTSHRLALRPPSIIVRRRRSQENLPLIQPALWLSRRA